jgi:serine/threonine-protein kinase
MGEVYRARDEHLNRNVAIKVLPAGTLADEHARRRFRKEAETLSKLNHAHIATVYDFDSQHGVDFLAMELVEGETLAEKLTQAPLSGKEISRLGAQIAGALLEAHEQGVVHRDLKPANIKLTTKGEAKVLDFGIAKLLKPVQEATTESFTETQALAGTLPYMSPEQLRDEPVDRQSDLYSFGVVLYEMATGQRPFQQKLSTALSDAILHELPRPPRTLNKRLSPVLENIILKCLEKEPESRYQSAQELVVDLRRLGTPETARLVTEPRRKLGRPALALIAVLILVVLGMASYSARQRFWPQATPPAGKIMLAVLPFDNLSADPRQEYFSDGMTEEMIAHLGRLEPTRLGVIARTSAMKYKGTNKGIDKIGEELGVNYILDGSVRREADRVRITAQLIQVSDQTHLWAESYERELAGVFIIQNEAAGRIAHSLKVELLPARQARLTTASSVDPKALEAYLKGRYFWNQRTREAVMEGLQYFEQATEIDPTYALAYVGVADSYAVLEGNLWLPPHESSPKVRAATLRALELDDTLAEAHTSLATMMENEWDWVGAERGYKRALEMNSSYASAHQWYSAYLSKVGRHEEAIAEAKRASELDPLSPVVNVTVGQALFYARRYDEAKRSLLRVLEIHPDFFPVYEFLGMTHVAEGSFEEGLAALQRAAALSSKDTNVLAELGYAYATSGRKSQAEEVLRELQKLSTSRYVSPYTLGMIYVGLGENEKALKWFEECYKRRVSYLSWLGVEPWAASLRSDSRYQDLLRRMNLPL